MSATVKNLSHRPTMKGNGRTAAVVVTVVVLVLSMLLPALSYRQNSADGQPIDISGSHPATALNIDASFANIDLVETDGDEITWEVTDNTAFHLTTVDTRQNEVSLDIDDINRRGGFWPMWQWIGNQPGERASVTIEVPAGTDVDADVSFGNADLHADFGQLDINGSFSPVEFNGSAEALNANLSYGELASENFSTAGPVNLVTSFADVNLDLGGQGSGDEQAYPRAIDIEASFADVVLALPQAPGGYRTTGNASFGQLTNSSPGPDGADGGGVEISYEISFGDILLTPSQ